MFIANLQKLNCWFLVWKLKSLYGCFIFVFQLKVGIRILSWSNSLNYIFHLDIPSSHSILFVAWSALNTYQEHHRFAGAEDSVGSGSSVDLPVCHCSNPLNLLLPPFCKWASVVPMYIFLPLAYDSVVWTNHCVGHCSYPGWNFLYLNCRCFLRGIGQSALALNRFVGAGMVLGHGVSSLTWKVGALGIASGCGLCWDFLQLGAFLWVGNSCKFPIPKLYTVTQMDLAAEFTMGIWVVAVEVATVGVGTVGIEFMGAVGVVGKGWVITFTLYLLFTGALALLFFSAILGTRIFLVKELLWEGMLVHGCNWGWVWSLSLGPSLPSNSRYVFIFLIKEG